MVYRRKAGRYKSNFSLNKKERVRVQLFPFITLNNFLSGSIISALSESSAHEDTENWLVKWNMMVEVISTNKLMEPDFAATLQLHRTRKQHWIKMVNIHVTNKSSGYKTFLTTQDQQTNFRKQRSQPQRSAGQTFLLSQTEPVLSILCPSPSVSTYLNLLRCFFLSLSQSTAEWITLSHDVSGLLQR